MLSSEGRRQWRWAATRLVAVFLVARLLLVGTAVAVEGFVAPTSAGPAGSSLRATERPLLASLTSWDAVYYLDIARDGYRPGPVNGPYPDTVFFPLYPAVVAAAGPLVGGDLPLAAVFVANLAGLAAMFAVYALARRRLSPDAALLATTLVAIQPGAVAFAMAYSDSLFLLLAVGAMLAAERGQRPLAGVLGALAALTRLPGVLLLVPLIVLFVAADGRRPRLSWLWSLGPALGLIGAGLLIGRVTGDPLSLITAQASWDLGSVPGAVAPTWVLAVAALVYAPTVGLGLWLGYRRWRARRDTAGAAWALANLGAVAVARRVASLPRYLAPVTQLAEELVGGEHSRRTVRLVLVGALAGYVVLAALHFSLLLAP
ncbi:MAG: glycosyltransferase family 39 protein [Candidatus Limnocylindrales bacterium]